MEQDINKNIKILEELLNAKITFTISTTDYGWKALEHLIKAYKELEEKWYKDTHKLQNDLDLANADKINNYIPVSLVEEKIEELKQERTLKYDNYMGYKIESREQQDIDKKVQVLKELLEKRK